jgi:hypothetical protein
MFRLNLFYVFVLIITNKFADLSQINNPKKLSISIKEFKEILETNVWNSYILDNSVQYIDDVQRFQNKLLLARNSECFFNGYENVNKIKIENSMIDHRSKLLKKMNQIENITTYESLVIQSFAELVLYFNY